MTAENLESSLQQAAVAFLNDSSNVQILPAAGIVRLSRYFDWFAEDFLYGPHGQARRHASPLDFVSGYLEKQKQALLGSQQQWNIKYFEYDWSLNDSGRDSARLHLVQ